MNATFHKCGRSVRFLFSIKSTFFVILVFFDKFHPYSRYVSKSKQVINPLFKFRNFLKFQLIYFVLDYLKLIY